MTKHLRLVVRLRHIGDQHTAMDIDLGRRQADAGRRVHGFEHVRRQLPQCGIEGRDRLGAGSQPGIGVLEDCQSGHGSSWAVFEQHGP